MKKQLKNKMIELLNLVFNDVIDDETKKSYEYFNIVLSKKELKKNESYKERTITVNNLFRQECEIANSLIVGLAHHIDFCNRGETDNKKPFLELYRTLLFTALDNQYILFDELKSSNDFNNSKVLKNILSSYWVSNYSSEKCILEVYNCFSIKDYLKKHNFLYNSCHQSWELEVNSNKVGAAIEAIYNKDKSVVVETRSPNKIVFGLSAYICISGKTFNYKDLLKKERYFYKNTKWYKKIMANTYLTEKENIEKILPKGQGLKISLEY